MSNQKEFATFAFGQEFNNLWKTYFDIKVSNPKKILRRHGLKGAFALNMDLEPLYLLNKKRMSSKIKTILNVARGP